MAEKSSTRIESGYRIVGETKAYIQVPTFDNLQKMSVKELLSVPAIERIVSIKAINFFSKFATKEGALVLAAAITMTPLSLYEEVVKISGEYVQDTVEARSALLILKESGSIIERKSKSTLLSFLLDPKSLFLDAILTVLDHIGHMVAETKSLKDRYVLVKQYIDSLDAIMLSLEYIAGTNTGAEVLLDVLTERYRLDINSTQCSNVPVNPFLMLLDVTYINNFAISLLCGHLSNDKLFSIKVNKFLLHTHLIDIIFYYLLPNNIFEALHTSSLHTCKGSPCCLDLSCILPASFISLSTFLHSETIKYNKTTSVYQKGVREQNNPQSQLTVYTHLSRAHFITEDELAHAVELLCHIMACGNMSLIESIVCYLPITAKILFSPELLILLPLHNLKLICTFSSTSVSMILRIPRLYVSEILGADELQRQKSNNEEENKSPFTRFSLYTIIETLAAMTVLEDNVTDIELPNSSSGSTQIPSNSHQSKLKDIQFDKALLPDEVENILVPVYNNYIKILAHFVQYQMPKMVSERFDSTYLARVSITMRHLASVFCILDDIGRMLYLSSINTNNPTEHLSLYADGDILTKESRFNYRYCGHIPSMNTISTTCPESINLYETYMIKDKILSPSPLSIFACVFPPQKEGKNPLLTLQLMLFNIKTGQQTIIKHYVTRILSSIIVFTADSTELFKRVISDIKLSAFLPSISIKKNKNPFCNLICEMLLRVCLQCNDICWKLYREQLSGYYRNRDTDNNRKELLYPLSLNNINVSLVDEGTGSLRLIRPLMESPDFVTYVINILEADHNRYMKIRNSVFKTTYQSAES